MIGEGAFIAYAASKPEQCTLDGASIEFEWKSNQDVDGCVTVMLPENSAGSMAQRTLVYIFSASLSV